MIALHQNVANCQNTLTPLTQRLSAATTTTTTSTTTRRKEGNVLFNGHTVKNHTDSVRGKPLPPLHGLLFPINIKVFYMHHATDRIA